MQPQVFELALEFERDSIWLADWPLCQLRVQNDTNYPWFILIPRRAGVTEIIDLTEAEQNQLWRESGHLSVFLKAQFQAKKLNIAALGNMVPQLHLHHIVRYDTDCAWPAPVWGKFPAQAYSTQALQQLKQKMASLAIPS
ncbi:HIT domain-containing protein [Rheinheimera mesophila]|jgi:diadenosine tetraphosphate (Ap4A) HIT family hydrolase|uniref:HIT domain-containing protein n=1 Tax=Rheinheimera mesophila TaxID=1547515 RepID=A0A3P3QQV9_9GAMM|nr:HIT domain-containing protein [Rheinheimera mesophila]KKL03343.1 histidine triad (HIT) protein [Rheinheimera mesophila]RRJ23646.1 HIT domain-containing protein [Rheinheimera mesophila]